MRKKILFCATVDYHFQAFHLPVLEWFKQRNWEVHVAASGNLKLPFVDHKYELCVKRSPLAKDNIQAYKQLKTIMSDHHYDLIHCHTPMGGVLSRLAARACRKQGTKVIYTAHGFHFYKGASLLNWLLYYPIERKLARMTDCLITINKEDYRRAEEHRFRARKIAHVHGVGVDLNVYQPSSDLLKRWIREEYGFDNNNLLLFYAAEFNRNKNQQLLIRAAALIKHKLPHAQLLLAGTGPMQAECRKLAEELGVDSMVKFLGYRKDIPKLLSMSDAAISSSLREGLPVNIMEAMACGLPIVGVRNRGLAELVSEGSNGFLVDNDAEMLAARLIELGQSAELRRTLGEESRSMMKPYSLENVSGQLTELYSELMNDTAGEKERLSWATL